MLDGHWLEHPDVQAEMTRITRVITGTAKWSVLSWRPTSSCRIARRKTSLCQAVVAETPCFDTAINACTHQNRRSSLVAHANTSKGEPMRTEHGECVS